MLLEHYSRLEQMTTSVLYAWCTIMYCAAGIWNRESFLNNLVFYKSRMTAKHNVAGAE